jgi:hypothetical protein
LGLLPERRTRSFYAVVILDFASLDGNPVL